MWLGYLAEHPDYMTQGMSQAELRENLRDINLYEGLWDGVQRPTERPTARRRNSITDDSGAAHDLRQPVR